MPGDNGGGVDGVLYAIVGLVGAVVLHGVCDFMALQWAMVFGTGPFLVLSRLLGSRWIEREAGRREAVAPP